MRLGKLHEHDYEPWIPDRIARRRNSGVPVGNSTPDRERRVRNTRPLPPDLDTLRCAINPNAHHPCAKGRPQQRAL
jgi:hypothetical protein